MEKAKALIAVVLFVATLLFLTFEKEAKHDFGNRNQFNNLTNPTFKKNPSYSNPGLFK